MVSENSFSFQHTQKITLTLPMELLQLIDALVRQQYATRSDVIRQALVLYANSKPLQPSLNQPRDVQPEKVFDGSAAQKAFPYVLENDVELLKFLMETNNEPTADSN